MFGKRSGAGGDEGLWITIAEKDLDAWNSLVLCQSLRRTLTTKQTCIIVTGNVSFEMRELLDDAFDFVTELSDATIQQLKGQILESDVSEELLLLLNVWKCRARKAVFLHPCSMVLKNSDQLFEMEEACVTTATTLKLKVDFAAPSLFVFEPNKRTYKDMLSQLSNWSSSNGETMMQQLLRSYFGKEDGDMKLGLTKHVDGEYGFLILGDKLENKKGGNFNMEQDVKIVHFAKEMPWTLDDENVLGQLWKDICYVTLLDIQSKYDDNDPDKNQFIKILLRNNHLPFLKAISPTSFSWQLKTSSTLLQQNQMKDLEDSISIIGLSCRFPGANNEAEFWDLLIEGRDETKPLPPERYFTSDTVQDLDTPVGYLKCPIEDFDAKFFEISPREAEFMDPQQRLLLEVSWESLENAGINPQKLNGSNTAVFVGLWAQEYAMYLTREAGKLLKGGDFTHKYLGNAICASAARISHYLGLRGPSVAIEAGCASALEGFHYACASLKSRESDLAISCGVNIALGASGEFNALDSFIFSNDGKCKTFDESADGFARGEACVAFVLKRTLDAIRDGDKILGLIRGSAMNSDGSGSALGTPNAIAQELVLRSALKNSGCIPNDISYIEAHGTGTPVGDPIEFHALNQVFSGHDRNQPLVVGSVKTNIGHTEAASGLSGLVKVLMCLRNKVIPKHLNLKTLNPLIKLNEIPSIIPLENIEWKPTSKLGLIAGVSSFGLSGTNVHVIVQEPPKIDPRFDVSLLSYKMERSHHIFVLSAKSETALKTLVSKYILMLEFNTSKLHLADLAYSASTGRAHFRHRLAVVSKDSDHLLRCLEKGYILSKKIPVGIAKSKVAFLFTGQGSQYICMGKSLYSSSPIFKSCFDKCARLLKSRYNLDLFEILDYSNSSNTIQNSEVLDNSLFSQPAIFCVEVCLAELWRSFGVVPDFVLGHSVGEFAAAVVAGVLSLEDGLKLVVERSKLVNTLEKGSMMVMKTSQNMTRKLIKEFEEYVGNVDNIWIDIAAINSDSEVVVSGGIKSIDLFESFCQGNASNVATQRLAATHAFHSRHMDWISNQYAEVALGVCISPPHCRYISGTYGKEMMLSDFDPSYWVSHLRKPVLFEKGFTQLVNEGCNIFVEIGSQPILLGLGMTSVSSEISGECIWCPSIRKNEDNWATILSSLAKMYINGFEVDWARCDAPYIRNRISLPNYPFQREKFWFKGKSSRESNSIIINSESVHPILGKRIPSPLSDSVAYYNSISLETIPYVKDHRIADKAILPGAAFVEMVLAAGLDVLSSGSKALVPLTLENMTVEAALELNEESSVQLQTIVTSITTDNQLKYEMKVYKQVTFDHTGSDGGKWKKQFSATFVPCVSIDSSSSSVSPIIDIQALKSTLSQRENNADDFYSRTAEVGVKFGPHFRNMHAVWYSETEILVETTLPEGSENYICHPIVLDSMIQSFIVSTVISEKDTNALYLPFIISKCMTFPNKSAPSNSIGSKLYNHVLGKASSDVNSSIKFEPSSVTLYNDAGHRLALMEGVELIRTDVQAFARLLASDMDEYPGFYKEIWQSRLGPRIRRLDFNVFKHPSLNCSSYKELLERCKALSLKHEPLRLKLNRLCYLYIVRALVQIGWNYRVGDVFNIPDFYLNGSILPKYSRVITNWVDVLEEEGNLQLSKTNSNEATVIKPLFNNEQVEVQILHLRNSLPDPAEYVEYRFIINCGEHLTSILQGKISPYAVLFPEDKSTVGALALYNEERYELLHELEGHLNFLMLQEISTQLSAEGKQIEFVYRILEVGAGSGSATHVLINKLNQLNIPYEYILTDISQQFLKEAAKKFVDNKNIRYKLLDIETDPKAQGFAPNYFDLVIADSVLHATKNLSESLNNIRQLLTSSGILLLTEQVVPFRLMDLSFAFMEGWWRFSDTELRPKAPFISSESWKDLLVSQGFREPKEYKIYEEFPYSIFMTFANPEPYIVPIQAQGFGKRDVWLLFGIFEDEFTEQMITMMKGAGKDCVVVYNSKSNQMGVDEYVVNPRSPNEIRDLLEIIKNEYHIDGIIYLWGMSQDFLSNSEIWDYEKILSELSGGLLHLMQGLAYSELRSKLYVVTKGANYVGEQEPNNPISAILWGILLSYNNEFSNQYSIAIDIDPAEPNVSNSCQDVFSQLWLNEPEHQIVFRAGVKYVKRLVHLESYQTSLVLPNTERYKLINPASGSFNDFSISATAAQELQPGDIEIKVVCCALNFKDVLLAMRTQDSKELDLGLNMELAPRFATELGVDFAGVISGMGNCPNSKYRVGDRVYGCISGGALRSHIVVSESSIALIPSQMSFEEASAISCVYFTAIYFLIRIANLKSTDKLLIHAAAGGVGLAAINIAQCIGAEIYATAGSKRKRAYLRSLGIKHVYNSRDTSYRREILTDTAGVGVNVVLNSLTSPNFKEATLSICAQGARFLEMAKLNVWTKEDVASLRPDIFYFIQDNENASDSARIFVSTDEEYEYIKDLIVKGLSTGQYNPLPFTRFPLSRVHDAFRYLQEAKHIGKVVVSMPHTSLINGRIEHKDQLFNCYSSYLITGGLGGIGMEVAKWMASSGAKYIVLVGRSPPSTRAESIISNLRADNINILVVQADVSDYSQCKAMFDRLKDPQTGFPPLKGIMHAAGVLSDGILINQTLNSLWEVYKSKVVGSWNLHLLTKDYTLDHFVLFSSLVSTLGGIGQVNHCSANKYLDSFARFRVEQGLPCVSINWGPWSDVGAAASVKNVEATFGVRMISPSHGIKSLERALLSQQTNTAVFDLPGNNVVSQTYNVGSLLDLINFQGNSSVENAGQFEARLKIIKECTDEEREEKIKEFLEYLLRDTLRLPENEPLDRDQDIREIGIDSLMAMELRSKMQSLLSDYDSRSLSIYELQENRTINKLGKILTGIINSGTSSKVLSPEELLELIKQDCILPEEIIACSKDSASGKVSHFRTVLLTGVTGHLGPCILRDLLNCDKNLKIYCIIRAKSDAEAKERLETTLDNLDMLDSVSLDTVVCLAGNLGHPNFGLNVEIYNELLENIDAIIHCAVVANLALQYGKFGSDDVRSNNVIALLNILKFATTAKVKPLQFASSIYAVSKLEKDGYVPDEFPSDDDYGTNLKAGYLISKFVCEKLLKQAVDIGIPIQVLRHHYLTGDSKTGLLPIQRNHMTLFLLTCLKIQMFPEIDFHVVGVPIDIAASVSVQLFLNPNVESGVYNINNPKICRLMELCPLLKERGYEFQIVPYNKWREAAFVKRDIELAPLADLYVNDLFSSDQFKQHPLVKNSLEENFNIFKNSDKLKKYIENIDEIMTSSLEMGKLLLDYYEKEFGRDNMNAFLNPEQNSSKSKTLKKK